LATVCAGAFKGFQPLPVAVSKILTAPKAKSPPANPSPKGIQIFLSIALQIECLVKVKFFWEVLSKTVPTRTFKAWPTLS
jgi:hypothetical protein